MVSSVHGEHWGQGGLHQVNWASGTYKGVCFILRLGAMAALIKAGFMSLCHSL